MTDDNDSKTSSRRADSLHTTIEDVPLDDFEGMIKAFPSSSANVTRRGTLEMDASKKADEHEPGGHEPVCFHMGNSCVYLPKHILNEEKFRKSVLGELVLEEKRPANCPYIIQKDNNDEWIISADAEVFSLFVKHVLEGKPMEFSNFTSFLTSFNDLVKEMKIWGYEEHEVIFPTRLWTQARWTDLCSFYTYSPNEAKMLDMFPVAVQLPDGTIQGIRLLERFDIFSSTESMKLLPVEVAPWQIVSAYSWGGYVVFLCDLDRHESDYNGYLSMSSRKEPSQAEMSMNGGSSDFANRMDVSGDQREADMRLAYKFRLSGRRNSAIFTERPRTDTSFAEEQHVTTIFIRIPYFEKICAFDLPRHFRNSLSIRGPYPHLYRRASKHFIWFSSTFGLELNELYENSSASTVAASGQVPQKVRSAIVGPKSLPAAVPQLAYSRMDSTVSATNSSWAASLKPTGFSGGHSNLKTKDIFWQCFHPMLGCRYGNNTPFIRDLGEFAIVRLFPWGALFVQNKLENPFAVLSVDSPSYRRTYAEKIAVYIRGLPDKADKHISRDMVDVTTTAHLERLFIVFQNQMASVAVLPHNPKLEVVLSPQKEEPAPNANANASKGQAAGAVGVASPANRKYQFKYANIDIPDGAPSGRALGHLHSLGMYAEFDVPTGLYFQNDVCVAVCPKYTVLRET